MTGSISGTVFGVALNHREHRAQMAAAFEQPPHQSPPTRSVLFIKTPNTLIASGDAVPFPAGFDEIAAGPALAVEIAAPLHRASAAEAMNAIAGYRLVNEISLIEDSVYRPPVVAKCRDGFCPVGELLAAAKLGDPDGIEIDCRVNGQRVQTLQLADLHLSVGELLADICEFITLQPGDLVITGIAEPRPRLRAGDTVRIESDGFAPLENTLAMEDHSGEDAA